MTKQEVVNTIRAAAERHGFTTKDDAWISLMHIDGGRFINFCVRDRAAKGTDWTQPEITITVEVSASIATMGGDPSADELLEAADTIRRAAELVKELEAMNLSYTHRIKDEEL